MIHMLQNLRLDHPVCFIDLETTGVSPTRDRIVEVAAVRFAPGIPAVRFVRRVHPGVPILPSATAVHHITDADVGRCPPFAAIAADLARFIGGADLAGFNVLRFDIPMLWAEFARAGIRASDCRRDDPLLRIASADAGSRGADVSADKASSQSPGLSGCDGCSRGARLDARGASRRASNGGSPPSDLCTRRPRGTDAYRFPWTVGAELREARRAFAR